MSKFDFSGWATRNNVRCSDGRTIQKDAFRHSDKHEVPLVWNHQHNDPFNVLGKALLENRDDGVYAYCTFNDTESGKNAKMLVTHGDVNALSIYANQLQQQGGNVTHGTIREVSLVLAGANPGAFIDSIIRHGAETDDEAIIYTDEELSLYHKEEAVVEEDPKPKKSESEEPEVKKDEKKPEKTVADVFDTLTEEQKTVVYAMIGQALETAAEQEVDEEDKSKGGTKMKHNVFDNDKQVETDNVLSHAETEAIFADAPRYGTLKESVLAHGTDNIDFLFPDAQNVTNTPQFIQRDMGWVGKVMNGTRHTPFSRIKSVLADITEDEARANGYIKGKLKKDEVFALLKRVTTPTIIYKKQKIDRSDVIDITDFDVVAWLKAEMRLMLDEEIARAVLVGDGRSVASDDKIDETCIRPIWKDSDLYTIKAVVSTPTSATDDVKAKAFIQAVVKARKDYAGSGEPSLYAGDGIITKCLLMEDTTGRIIYDSIEKLAGVLRVKEIVTVPVMEGLTRIDSESKTRTLLGLVANLADYNIGADKGGAVNMFDDFDIDYNAQKYLIETRCSGALIKLASAIAVETVEAAG